MTDCVNSSELVNERLNRVLTQYRESPKLLFLMKTYLTQIAETGLKVCDLPEKFNIDDAIGDQLTLLGKRLGWPRCHCVCDTHPVFGFECEDDLNLRPVVGFGDTTRSENFGFCDDSAGFSETVPVTWNNCDPRDFSQAALNSTWKNCATGLSEICINDDETYRKFLKVRIYQMLGYFDISSLETCVRIFFGNQAKILHSGQGRVVIAPNRDLNETEILLLKLYPRVLPVALGIETRYHFDEIKVFGFGDGWGGFCEDDSSTYDTVSYNKTGKVFGFACENRDVGGFCEDWLPDGLPIVDENGNSLTTAEGVVLNTGALKEDSTWLCMVGAPWMCEIDVQPYAC